MNWLQGVTGSLFHLPPVIVERAQGIMGPGAVEDVRIFSARRRSNTDQERTFPCPAMHSLTPFPGSSPTSHPSHAYSSRFGRTKSVCHLRYRWVQKEGVILLI